MNNNLMNRVSKPKFSVAVQSDAYKNLINNTLGDKEIARQFIADITTVVSANPTLQSCDAGSIISAGLMAQSLKLPLANSLGFAYVVPYKEKAQFQIGWKGLVQLAQRTGLFETIGVRPVHKGEYDGQDEFGEDLFKFSHDYDNEEVIGYFAYFKLVNGFKKTLYWTKNQCENHARKYSRAYGTGKTTDLWTNSFDAMACKTVLKRLLNQYAPMSVDIQKGITADQAIINNDGTYDYVDNSDNEEMPDWMKEEAPQEVEEPISDNKALRDAFVKAQQRVQEAKEEQVKEEPKFKVDENGELLF